MAVSAKDSEVVYHVAHLRFRVVDQPEAELREYRIFPNDEFDIGRSAIYEALGIEDRCISTHHLRFHCVKYGDIDQPDVTPMVYMRVLSMNSVLLTRNGLDGSNACISVTNNHGYILLNPGDSVQITHQIIMDFDSTLKIDPRELNETCKVEAAAFAKQYRLSNRVLGRGGYASVYVANKEASGQQFACKVIDQDGVFSASRSTFEDVGKSEGAIREYEILKCLSHPNIVSLEKVITTPFNVYIFQELATGGDLLSYLDRKAPLEETQAAFIIKQLLEAVKYLHDHHVVHRDIKPENILITSWKNGARLILTDFGQSKTIADFDQAAEVAVSRRMHTMVGTAGYIAPEVLQQRKTAIEKSSGYSKAVDMWSVGCTATALMTGYPIFPDEPLAEVEHIDHLTTLEKNEEWKHIGHRGKTFIRGCLITDESKRLTAERALQLPWFTHPFYKAEFDAAYQKAIEDWGPRRQSADVIEHIDTTNAVQKHKERVLESTCSKHFAAGQSAFRILPAVLQNAPDGRPSGLHASPAPSSGTPPQPRPRPPQRQKPIRRTSERQDTLNSIAHPPGHHRRSIGKIEDLFQTISLPPKSQAPVTTFTKRPKAPR